MGPSPHSIFLQERVCTMFHRDAASHAGAEGGRITAGLF